MAKLVLGEDGLRNVVQHYGRIKAGVYHYVTPPMVLSLVLMITVVTLGFDKIRAYFMHGPVLNGLMLIVLSSGIVMAIRGNLSIFYVARLIHKVDEITERGVATHKEIHDLRTALERRANLLSMAIFSTALEKMEATGRLLISDPDARQIKSKFGARVAHMRSKVNYLCGIMVMLGLIGTFWGLLGTISSVGQAMGKISESFNAGIGGGAGNIDMGGFLQSISKPLEGMGIGFSASLFGLTGSLFLGFFNYLCGHAQNKFIENFGRWMDDCIPSVSAGFVEKMKGAAVPDLEELKAWLAGFIYLSNKTHSHIGELVTALATSTQVATARLEETQKLFANQNKVLKALEIGNKRMKGIHASIHSMGGEMKSLGLAFKNLPDSVGKLTGLVGDGLRSQQKAAEAHLEHITDLFQRIESHLLSLANATEAHTQILQETQSTHTPAMNGTTAPDAAELKANIAALLGEMHNKNDEALLGLFLRDGKAKSIDGVFSNPN